MTIKQRLVISNISMIFFPVILTIAMGLTISLVVFGITGTTPNADQNNKVMFVYNLDENIDSLGVSVTEVTNNIAAYQTEDGNYIFEIPDEDIVSELDFSERNFYAALLIIFIITTIVIITNSILTRLVFRSIMVPINTLVGGVHEIRDGNLKYRIDYQKNDEFAPVCDDFNEMASRLSNLVEERQKDEQNRRELIAGISHDLRTPLTSIKAYVEGLDKGVASTPEAQKKYLTIINRKTEDLEYIINQLFLFSKMDAGEFPMNLECVNMGQLVKDTTEILEKDYADQGMILKVSDCNKNLYSEVDVVQFRNVIQNILGNSVKYKKKEIVHIDVSCKEVNKGIQITISDDGPGVSEEGVDKLFDVFYRGDPSRQSVTGSGLGLAITEKIIERFRGSIKAENAKDCGLRIVIWLPSHEGGCL